MRHSRLLIFIPLLFFALIVLSSGLPAQNTPFVLVIDAGHGGYDPGALGDISKEKDINLAIALQLGALVEKEHKDVTVYYTRKTDKFLKVDERATFANSKKANLFISIHTNAVKNKAVYGTETFVFGLAKSEANLAVAMRENSVILLEDDYKTQYKGFDPNSIDSYIMFELMQDKYLDQSLEFAAFTQEQFKNYCKRHDRGVRQAGFWVLHATAAPSVLVELGFISNKEEERYMNSKDGQLKLSTALSKAFSSYKHNYDKKSGKLLTPAHLPEKNETEQAGTTVTANEASKSTPVFKVQLFAKKTKLGANAPELKNLKDISYYEENGFYKYTAGNETEYRKIVALKEEIINKFPDAFIVAFLGDKKIMVSEALKLSN